MKTYTLYFRLFFILFAFATTTVQAQDIVKSLESDVPGQGKVRIYQDPKIEAQLGKERSSVASDDGRVVRMSGYRVQVYSGGNSRNSKNEAASVAARVKSTFPELKVSTLFNPPRWLCRVGDFTTIEEADDAMRKLRKEGGFKEVSIVKEQVNISL